MNYQELLDQTIPEPMPPFENVDGIIRRERRAQTRRRVAAAGVTAFGVVAVITAVTAFGGTPIAFTPPIGATVGPVTGGPSPTAEPSPSAQPAPIAQHAAAPEPARADLHALTEALKAHLAVLLPKSAFTRNDPGSERDFPALTVGVVRGEGVPKGAGYQYLYASADIAGGDGAGSVAVLIGRVDHGQPRALWCTKTGRPADDTCLLMTDVSGVLDVMTDCDEQLMDDPRSCSASTGPNGENIVIIAGSPFDGRVEHRVDVIRPDGTALQIMCRNWMGVGEDRGQMPPLSVDDLLELALDPRLAVPR